MPAGSLVFCRYSALPYNGELCSDLRLLGSRCVNSADEHAYVAKSALEALLNFHLARAGTALEAFLDLHPQVQAIHAERGHAGDDEGQHWTEESIDRDSLRDLADSCVEAVLKEFPLAREAVFKGPITKARARSMRSKAFRARQESLAISAAAGAPKTTRKRPARSLTRGAGATRRLPPPRFGGMIEPPRTRTST